MKDEGKPASAWLNRITKDQNLEDLDNITITRMDGFRRWFTSRILQPNLNTGYYGRINGKYILGSEHAIQSTGEVSTTSAGTHTFTVPAGEMWRVHCIWSINATRAHTWAGTNMVIDGVTFDFSNATGAAINTPQAHWGGSQTSGVNGTTFGKQYIYMTGGDTINLINNNFVAADVMFYGVMYELVEG